MNNKGIIVSWNDAKGYGFIEPEAGGKKVFVHISELRGIARQNAVGTAVIYRAENDAQGRLNAAGVRPVNRRMRGGVATIAFIIAGGFLGAVATGVELGKLPSLVLWLYGALSALTFLMYALDKSSARKGGQRVREDTLHLLALLGGWPGALYAQQLLRHKSRKTSFRIAFWVTLLLNVAALGYLLSEQGQWISDVLYSIQA